MVMKGKLIVEVRTLLDFISKDMSVLMGRWYHK